MSKDSIYRFECAINECTFEPEEADAIVEAVYTKLNALDAHFYGRGKPGYPALSSAILCGSMIVPFNEDSGSIRAKKTSKAMFKAIRSVCPFVKMKNLEVNWYEEEDACSVSSWGGTDFAKRKKTK